MQVKWAKTKAHTNCWDKEYLLMVEEMQCILEYCDWKAGWWTQRALLCTDIPADLQSGLHAYAHKQAAVYHDLARSLANKWHPLMISHSIPVKWPAAYIPVIPVSVTATTSSSHSLS